MPQKAIMFLLRRSKHYDICIRIRFRATYHFNSHCPILRLNMEYGKRIHLIFLQSKLSQQLRTASLYKPFRVFWYHFESCIIFLTSSTGIVSSTCLVSSWLNTVTCFLTFYELSRPINLPSFILASFSSSCSTHSYFCNNANVFSRRMIMVFAWYEGWPICPWIF